MIAILAMSFQEHIDFYRSFLMRQWRHMTPTTYVVLLSLVLVGGWLMMRSGTKRC